MWNVRVSFGMQNSCAMPDDVVTTYRPKHTTSPPGQLCWHCCLLCHFMGPTLSLSLSPSVILQLRTAFIQCNGRVCLLRKVRLVIRQGSAELMSEKISHSSGNINYYEIVFNSNLLKDHQQCC